MKNLVILFGIILALSLNLLACAEDGKSCTVTQAPDNSSATITCEDSTTATISSQECAIPPSTLMMQHSWAEGQAYRIDCYGRTSDLLHDCTLHSEDLSGGVEECMEGYDDESAACEYFYAMRANKFTIRECGLEVFEMLTPLNEYDPHNETQRLWKASDTDHDGDGISNYWEYVMGYNPCTPQSFGCVNDADLDYDVDGIPNGEDDLPLCNMNDPAGWVGDCV